MALPELSDRTRTIIIAVGSIGLLVGLGFVGAAGLTGEEARQATFGVDFVQEVTPPEGSEVLRQSTVGVRTDVGYDGTLTLNGVQIPPDELVKTPSVGLIQFTPGAGRAVETLAPDENCVSATLWPVAQGPGASEVVSWCFTAA